jgi:hypothetical protein
MKSIGYTSATSCLCLRSLRYVHQSLDDARLLIWIMLQVTVDSETYDSDAKRAVLHLFSTATTPLGKYGNEYAIFLTFTEDGSKLTRVEEMVDSKSSDAFFVNLRKHLQKNEGDPAAAWEHAVGES